MNVFILDKYLGYEEAHEDITPGMYNEPGVTIGNIFSRSGIAPKIRHGVFAAMYLNQEFLLLGEDDCHFSLRIPLDMTKVSKILEDITKLRKHISKKKNHLKVGYHNINRVISIDRKNTNDLLYFSINDSILTFDVYWLDDLERVLKESLEVYKKASPKSQ